MAARSTRSMAENRITHIISVCADPVFAEVPASGISHMRIPVEDVDYADLLIHLPSACQFIDQAIRSGGVVFVHCVQGISRSPTVVAAYCRPLIFGKKKKKTDKLHPKHSDVVTTNSHRTSIGYSQKW
jgi:dual specificity phosphatase 12